MSKQAIDKALSLHRNRNPQELHFYPQEKGSESSISLANLLMGKRLKRRMKPKQLDHPQ